MLARTPPSHTDLQTAAQKRAGAAGADAVGFFSNPKRFNVAITRARALLVVVGHPTILIRDTCWSELVRFCVAHGAVRGAGAGILQRVPFNPDSVAYRSLSEGAPHEQGEEARVAAALQDVAHAALLGAGCTEDDSYAAFTANAFAGEAQWRIAL